MSSGDEFYFFLFFAVTGPVGVAIETSGARSVAAGFGFTVPAEFAAERG